MWMMQYTGTKEAVRKAIKDYVLPGAPPSRTPEEERVHPMMHTPEARSESQEVEQAQLDKLREQALALIDLLPSNQNGVEVRIAGGGEMLSVFSVEGRHLTV